MSIQRQQAFPFGKINHKRAANAPGSRTAARASMIIRSMPRTGLPWMWEGVDYRFTMAALPSRNSSTSSIVAQQ